MSDMQDSSNNVSRSHKSRIDTRKSARRLKKLRRQAFSQNKPIPTKDDIENDKLKEASKLRKREKARIKNKERRHKLFREKRETRIQTEKEKEKKDFEVQKEAKELKAVERHLKMKKNAKTLPKAFLSDGLDYILDAVNEDKLKLAKEGNTEMDDSDHEDILADEDSDSNDESESENEFSSEENESEVKKNTLLNSKTIECEPSPIKLKTKNVSFEKSDDPDEMEEGEEEEDTDDNNSNSDDENMDSDGENEDSDENDSNGDDENQDSNDNNNSGDENKFSGKESDSELPRKNKVEVSCKEDIYGRLRDEHGNVVDAPKQTGAYIPPAKRQTLSNDSDKRRLMLERLRKILKGLVNRLSEANIQPISKQIEELYMSNSRADVSEILSSLIMESCISPVLTPERLVMELTLLVTILHSNVGNEVGAHMIQMLAEKFDALCKEPSYGEDKRMNNVIMIFASLYNFKVVRSTLMFDIFRKFVNSFEQKDIELILLLLKNAGFSLRKDDSVELKALMLEIRSKASTADFPSAHQSRVTFMLDILIAIRNNNMKKIPNYDPEHLEHLKKLARSCIRGSGLADNQLEITLSDLLQAEKKGRWWLVGSAWEGSSAKLDAAPKLSSAVKANSKIMDLARKMRMNTDIRKTIFCIIMTSEDFVDAFEKLLRLGLKQQQEREIVHVIQECCLQEKKYNPFYAILIHKFCEYDRKYQMTFQFALWDKFKEMANLSMQNLENYARLVSYVIVHKGISLAVLKIVEFGTLSKPMVRFLKYFLRETLTKHTDDVVQTVFHRVAKQEKLQHLHDGLKVFMQHFLCKNIKGSESDVMQLKEKVEVAERALNMGQQKILL